jgi:pimeloyl-ACP methyl ester carboxylesterase
LPYILRSTYRRPTLNALVMERLPQWVFQIAVEFTSQAMGRIGEGISYLPEEIRFQTALDYKRTHPGAFNIPNTVHDLTSKLPRIQQPTLVLWGTHDQTLRPDLFQPIVRELPNAQPYILKAGHVPHQSHPNEFIRAVREFLDSL